MKLFHKILLIVFVSCILLGLYGCNNSKNLRLKSVEFQSIPDSDVVKKKIEAQYEKQKIADFMPAVMPKDHVIELYVYCTKKVSNDEYLIFCSSNKENHYDALVQVVYDGDKINLLSLRATSGYLINENSNFDYRDKNNNLYSIFLGKYDINTEKNQRIFIEAYKLGGSKELTYEKVRKNFNKEAYETGFIELLPAEYNYIGGVYYNKILKQDELVNCESVVQNMVNESEYSSRTGLGYKYPKTNRTLYDNQPTFFIGKVKDYTVVYQSSNTTIKDQVEIYESPDSKINIVRYKNDILVLKGGLRKEYNLVDIDIYDSRSEVVISDDYGFGLSATEFIGVYNDKLTYLGILSGFYSESNELPKLNKDGTVYTTFTNENGETFEYNYRLIEWIDSVGNEHNKLQRFEN